MNISSFFYFRSSARLYCVGGSMGGFFPLEQCKSVIAVKRNTKQTSHFLCILTFRCGILFTGNSLISQRNIDGKYREYELSHFINYCFESRDAELLIILATGTRVPSIQKACVHNICIFKQILEHAE